jgi:hypothetical protein
VSIPIDRRSEDLLMAKNALMVAGLGKNEPKKAEVNYLSPDIPE